ncbi:MAG: ribonuclease HII [Anaeroplasmataceae bacterium]
MTDCNNLYSIEEDLFDNGYSNICGVDEVGRGPIAGPLVVSAVIMPYDYRLNGVNDSKQLSETKRESLYKEIVKNALAISTIFIYEDEIDDTNIYQATIKAMLKAINSLKVKPDYCLIDAMPLVQLEIPHDSIIKGDSKSASIAAASIIAKVTRDEYMKKMDLKFPNYGFARHKGYLTDFHKKSLDKFGPCEIHRKSFKPVSDYFVKTDKQIKFEF